MYILVFVCIYGCMYIRMYVCSYECMHITYVRTYVCTWVCIYLHACVYMYIGRMDLICTRLKSEMILLAIDIEQFLDRDPLKLNNRDPKLRPFKWSPKYKIRII